MTGAEGSTVRAVNYSRQRELVLQTVMEHPVHPTANTVYKLVRRSDPRISLGTVYRNLNLLSEMGLLRKIAMPVGSDRFDGRLDEHYHMACTCCGRVFDVECGALRSLDRDILAAQGFEVQNHHLLLTGLCRECREASGL